MTKQLELFPAKAMKAVKRNQFNQNNKTQRLIAYILSGKPITAIEAVERFGVMRLASRIFELREAGHVIDSKKVDKNGVKFVQYRLVKQ